MKVLPLRDRVVVEKEASPETSPGGIVIPQNARDKSNKGKVVAVGPGHYNDHVDKIVPLVVKVGDRVLFSEYSGTYFSADSNLVMLREDEILGVITD